MNVLRVELEIKDQLLALEKHLVHLPHTLNCVNFLNQSIELFFDCRFKFNRVFRHLEWNTSALRKFDVSCKLSFKILQIVGLSPRVLGVELIHEHDGVREIWRWFQIRGGINSISQDQMT